MSDWAVSLASMVVAALSGLAAWASQKAAARASTLNTSTTSRVEMEREAYERARKFDTDTITRQDNELLELQDKYNEIKQKNADLNDQVVMLTAENRGLLREHTELTRQVLSLTERIAALEAAAGS